MSFMLSLSIKHLVIIKYNHIHHLLETLSLAKYYCHIRISCIAILQTGESLVLTPGAVKQRMNTASLKCSIISCNESFRMMRQVVEHLNERHHQNLQVQHLEFSTEADVESWIRNVERSELCTFLRRKVRRKSSEAHTYYYCSRSGTSQTSSEPRKRHLKVQGYSKINRTCPAHIIKHVTRDGISVEYYATHLCYTDPYEQLGHLRLSVADREWLAGKLALRIPLDTILREVRNTLNGQLTRLHIVTKQDLSNIEKAFHLNKPQRRHEDDGTSVCADSDNADSDRFHMDTTNGVRLRHGCEAAAHIQQLSRPNTKLEEVKKELKNQLLETSLFIDTLTTLEQVAVVKSALFGIKPIVTAVRAKETMMSTSLVPTAESSREPSNKNVVKQRRFFSTKRRAPVAFRNALAKPSNDERKKIQLELMKTNLIANSIGGGNWRITPRP